MAVVLYAPTFDGYSVTDKVCGNSRKSGAPYRAVPGSPPRADGLAGNTDGAGNMGDPKRHGWEHNRHDSPGGIGMGDCAAYHTGEGGISGRVTMANCSFS